MTPERIAELQALSVRSGAEWKPDETVLELLAEVARLTRERDEAFNVGIEAAAKFFDDMDADFELSSHVAAAFIRALKKPATDANKI